VNEPPPGIGGPNGPLLTSLTASPTPAPVVNSNFSDVALITQQQNDLSTTGAIRCRPAGHSTIRSVDFGVDQLGARNHSGIQSAPHRLIELVDCNNLTGDIGWTQRFSPGTQLSMTFDNTRLKSNAARYSYNPLLNSSLGFTITSRCCAVSESAQPAIHSHRKNNGKIADLVFRQQVIDTVAGIARLYTDW